MAVSATTEADSAFVILAVTQGQWGERIADNVHRFAPATWTVHRWAAPRALPLLIDDPADFLPPTFSKADLILALGETAAVAQLIPDIVKMARAKSVIAPIDRNESLPPGLAAQLRNWLTDLGVAVAFPKPFCSLTDSTYNQPPIVVTYDDPIIRRFAQHFGKPQLRVTVTADKHISAVEVERDSACGCARFVAQGLMGMSVEEAEYEAGMLHHHYPCLASMNQDAGYNDTLMHVSGHILRLTVKEQIEDHLEPTPYLSPPGRVEIEDET
jgi:hypothetical protein